MTFSAQHVHYTRRKETSPTGMYLIFGVMAAMIVITGAAVYLKGLETNALEKTKETCKCND